MSVVSNVSPAPGEATAPGDNVALWADSLLHLWHPLKIIVSDPKIWPDLIVDYSCQFFRELLQLGEFLQRVEMLWMGCITATMDIWFKILQSKCWWYIIKVKSLNTKNSFKYDFHQLDSKTPTLALLAGCNCFCSEGQSPPPVSERHKKHVRWLLTIFIGAHTSILLSELSIKLPVIVTWLCFNRFELFRKQMDHAIC